jgi:hypothetical protein
MMPKISNWIIWIVFLAVPALRAQSPEAPAPALAPKAAPTTAPAAKMGTARKAVPATKASQKTRHKKPAKVVKKAALPALPGGPLRQLPMDQIPSTPATVTYQGGMLSISAQNSPLGEILREVRKLTGAAIEMPPHAAASDERVITHLGPGKPRDVLVALLNGSSFNYVMLGSNSDPAMISNIILTAKTPGGEGQTVANAAPGSGPSPGVVMPPHPIAAPQAFNPQMGQPVPPGNGEAEENKEEEPENAVDENANSDEPVQPGQNGQGEINGAQDPNQPNAGPKTPEQILEMLRRQQQQQPPGGPPPQ